MLKIGDLIRIESTGTRFLTHELSKNGYLWFVTDINTDERLGEDADAELSEKSAVGTTLKALATGYTTDLYINPNDADVPFLTGLRWEKADV